MLHNRITGFCSVPTFGHHIKNQPCLVINLQARMLQNIPAVNLSVLKLWMGSPLEEPLYNLKKLTRCPSQVRYKSIWGLQVVDRLGQTTVAHRNSSTHLEGQDFGLNQRFQIHFWKKTPKREFLWNHHDVENWITQWARSSDLLRLILLKVFILTFSTDKSKNNNLVHFLFFQRRYVTFIGLQPKEIFSEKQPFRKNVTLKSSKQKTFGSSKNQLNYRHCCWKLPIFLPEEGNKKQWLPK